MNQNLHIFLASFAFTAVAFGQPATEADEVQELAKTLSYTKWSGDLVVPDPISISFDSEGRAYVTQTRRRKVQDLDIRNNRDWVPNDVGLDSVEAKRAFFKSRLSADTSAANAERVADLNQDGVHDYRDLMVLTETIYRVEDMDKDGTADKISVFAEDFKTEVTGIAAGVLWDEGTVYATVAPDVWKLRDTDDDGVADQREILSTGYGLHIAYGGHDMHGLIVGPDGKIYWSIGDKGINAVSQDGKRFYYPNQGGVMRCNPDGSDFEVFAHGLRNVQEFAFDAYGNWFGVDNDSDQKGESERFVHIVEGMDAGWRNNYQYRGEDYNPWMEESLWTPGFYGQAAYIVPAIQNYVDGPAGFVFNPGTALNPQYKDYFFVNSTMQGSQYAFQTEQNGASFVMKNSHKIDEGRPLIGMTVGLDGALYSVDWGGGYPLNERGAIWKLDDNTGVDRFVREKVAALLSEGMEGRRRLEVVELLGHEDQRIRLKAQFELVRRGDIYSLTANSTTGRQLKRIHAIWGLGQIARKGSGDAIETIVGLLQDGDSEIQVQAAKMLSDLGKGSFDGEALMPLLDSEDPRVLFQAGLAIGNHGVETAFDPIVEMIARNNGKDYYLRHAGIFALAGIGGAERLSGHESEEVRLSAVVALRRDRNPEVAVFLQDASANVSREAALAIHDDLSIPEAMSALASLIEGPVNAEDKALVLRAINANFRLGEVENARRVAAFAARESLLSQIRIEAIASLGEWIETPLLDRVDGRHRLLANRSAEVIAESVSPTLNNLLASKDGPLLESVVRTAGRLDVVLKPEALDNLLKNPEASEALRVLALENLDTQESIDYALASDLSALRSIGAGLLVARDPARATELLKEQLQASASIPEKQNALVSLASIESAAADAVIKEWADQLALGTVPASLQLDVIESATKRGFTDAVAAFDSKRNTENPSGAFIETLEGGDPLLGERVVNNHLAAQCVRCHRFSSASGSKIGPNLKSIGKKDKEYLLRSIVDPGAEVAKGFGVITVGLKDGTSLSGVEGDETDGTLEILAVDGTAKIVSKDQIQSRSAPISTMPPMGYVLTKRELRDVIAYLSELKD